MLFYFQVNFQEGSNIILTLKDQEVLKEDDDVLINVNMIDDEKYKKVYGVYKLVALILSFHH